MRGILKFKMKILLSQYQEGVPENVEGVYDPKKLDLEFVDLVYTKPLSLRGTIEKGRDTLSFKGCLQSDVENICGRCLKKIPSHVDKPFELFYEIRGKEFIETMDDIREVLILDHPISFVCREGCRGLCPHCGVNRNETECRCESPKMSSRPFAGLKMIWGNKKER